VDRLALISAQDAPILLRASFSAHRVRNLLSCSPSVNKSSLQIFDDLLRSAVCHITNSAMYDIQWLQASMPIKQGGLGVRRVTSLAIPAFLASAAGTVQEQICTCPIDSFFDCYFSDWSIHPLVRHQNHCLVNSPSGTNLVSRPTVHSSRRPWSSRRRWQGISLQWRHIVVTGCWLYRSPTAH